MPKSISFLTFLSIVVGFFSTLKSATLSQKDFQTHLRWSIEAPIKALQVKQSGKELLIKTLDKSLFELVKKDMVLMQAKAKYISSFEFDDSALPLQPAIIKIQLQSQAVELFSFYQDQRKSQIIDFWINKDMLTSSEPKQKNKKTLYAVPKKPAIAKAKPLKKKVIKSKKIAKEPKRIVSKSLYRDFRYGASFVWDYPASIPKMTSDFSLQSKAPDFLYKIKNFDIDAGKKEAHMQLSLNFYKKQDWGLMSKSIGLYENKYPNDKNKDINDFMKAVSLIKNTIKPRLPLADLSQKGTYQSALNILSTIASRTSDYELQKACYRYLLEQSVQSKKFLNSIQIAKKLYVISTEQFDDDMIMRSSKAIIHSLAQLKQYNKIDEFLSNKAVIRLLPGQVGLAYKSYVSLTLGNEKDVIKSFETAKKGLIQQVSPSYLFNVAESYFRQAQYKKALTLYDRYITDFSQTQNASFARLRMALSYDLLGSEFLKVSRLYKDAINKSSNLEARYEAKVRYVGHDLLRTIERSELNDEKIVFLEASKGEKEYLKNSLKHLLWQVRLRAFIVQEDYNAALSYLSSIPLEKMPLRKKESFELDGSEAVLGMIKKEYFEQDYARVLKFYNTYKDSYKQKLSKNNYLSYLVTSSYLKLGLMKAYKKTKKELEKKSDYPVESFPLWVKEHKKLTNKQYLIDLEIDSYVLNKDWSGLKLALSNNKTKLKKSYSYYLGLLNYQQKNYKDCVKNYENALVTSNHISSLSPSERANMTEQYIEALFQTSSDKDFRKKTNAIIGDLRRSGKSPRLVQKAQYLKIESLFASGKRFADLKKEITGFEKEFPLNQYQAKVNYIKAMSFINTNEKEEGKKILNQLLEGKDTPEYLKGLARSELTTLVFENKKI